MARERAVAAHGAAAAPRAVAAHGAPAEVGCVALQTAGRAPAGAAGQWWPRASRRRRSLLLASASGSITHRGAAVAAQRVHSAAHGVLGRHICAGACPCTDAAPSDADNIIGPDTVAVALVLCQRVRARLLLSKVLAQLLVEVLIVGSDGIALHVAGNVGVRQAVVVGGGLAHGAHPAARAVRGQHRGPRQEAEAEHLDGPSEDEVKVVGAPGAVDEGQAHHRGAREDAGRQDEVRVGHELQEHAHANNQDLHKRGKGNAQRVQAAGALVVQPLQRVGAAIHRHQQDGSNAILVAQKREGGGTSLSAHR